MFENVDPDHLVLESSRALANRSMFGSTSDSCFILMVAITDESLASNGKTSGALGMLCCSCRR